MTATEFPFDRPKSQDLNQARLQHLASLGLDLSHKRVLETGAGIGLLTGFWERRECEVISTEGRQANIDEHLRRHPHREGKVLLLDLERPGSHDHLGPFDVVFCYGTLYHVPDPYQILEDLARVCRNLFLLESRVWWLDDGQVHEHADSNGLDQALRRHSCLPSRNWLLDRLREIYGYAYVSVRQPRSYQFPLVWPTEPSSKTRAIFVASRSALHLDTLSERLLNKQEYL